MIQTRSQKDSQQAYEHISQLSADKYSATQKKLYGSICHNFPIMVLRSGLAQSVAFLWIKAESGKPAYEKFMQHLSEISGAGKDEPFNILQQRIQSMELDEYQRTTRKILNACIWYKRFAESLLNVKAGEEIMENEG